MTATVRAWACGVACARRGALAGAVLAAVLLGIATPAPAQPPTRAEVQHLLRRFAFSAPPATVDAVLAGGIPAWLAAQADPASLDDSGTQLETLPTALVNGGYPDYNIFERAVVQHMLLTPRQLQAKLELHWLDHFSVGLGKVGDPAEMYHYDQTVRANALGNFATLLAAVAQEPAMLVWLDNNWNTGPVANENFAREAMQLYTTGLYVLNDDGSLKLNANQQPIPNYGQKDVAQFALSMTGYAVIWDSTDSNPQTRFSVQYYRDNHYARPLTFFGKLQSVPKDGTAIAAMMQLLAHRPSTAPFQVRELLRRFVTERPSPKYVADIVAVWRKYVDAPDQIARVMAAIAAHPQFNASYHAMPKQPVELVLGALRQLPGAMEAAANAPPGNSLLWELSELGQQPFWPVSVFSFYPPGNVSATINTSTVLNRTGVFANITNATPDNSYTDTYLDLPALRGRIGGAKGVAVRDYLLDALLDGGSDGIRPILGQYLGATPSDNQIRGGIWLLLNAPDYAVN